MWLRVAVSIVLFGSAVSYRMSQCSRAHEEFSLCAWKCPPTCVNLQLLAKGVSPCPARWECRVGCRCSAGYLRDEYTKSCVKVQDCPAKITHHIQQYTMKVFVVLAATIAVGLAAPANTVVYGVKRSKKSTYGAPCGGGSQYSPIALYLAPQAPPPQGPHYRESDAVADTENHEHPSARSYYEAGSPLAGLAAASASASGPVPFHGDAVGVFPHANLGGCATPLLLSCAPKVVSGHIVKHTGYAHPAPAPAYREAETTQNMEMDMKEAGMEKSWAGAERTASQHHENFHHSPVAQGHHHHEAMQHNMAHQGSSHQGSSHQGSSHHGSSLQHSHNHMTKL